MIVTAAPPWSYNWLAQRAEFTPSPEFKGILAWDENRSKICGMAGFDGWTENSVVVTIALDHPSALRYLLMPTFDFIFAQAGRGVALATVRGSNSKSQKLVTHAGWKEVYRIRDGVKVGEDLILYEMRREDCRWIRKAA